MALEVQENNRCDQCLLCFQSKLWQGQGTFLPFESKNKVGKYLIIYLQPSLEMIEHEFDLEQKNYAYRHFLKLLKEDYIHHPILRASYLKEIKPNQEQINLCKTFLFDFISDSKFEYCLVLGKQASQVFGLELNRISRKKIGSKIITFLSLESPSTIYYSSPKMTKDYFPGDEYYLNMLNLLEEL